MDRRSEFHAWGDSNLYLRRDADERITLTIEHRAEAAPEPLQLEIATDPPEYPRLRLINPDTIENQFPQKLTASQKIINAFVSAQKPMTITEIRAAVTLRNATVSQALDSLSAQGVIRKHNGSYELIASAIGGLRPRSRPPLQMSGTGTETANQYHAKLHSLATFLTIK